MQPNEKAAIHEAVKYVRMPCIVELGSRGGEDERDLRACFSEPARYVMVEPDMRNCQIILDAPWGRGVFIHTNRRLVLGAISDHNGTATFYASQNEAGDRLSGSIRRPTGHLDFFPNVEFPAELQTVVPCYTLDEIFRRENLEKIDLLWVDIQGAENLMIAGGQMALSRTRFLFIEAETEELYEGEALKPDLIALLPGWTLLEDFGFNLLLRNDRCDL